MKREDMRLKYAFQLAKYIKGFGVYLIFGILSNMIFKILPLLMSLVTSYLVSSVLFGDMAEVTKLMITTAILVLLSSLFSYLDVQISHDMAYRILTQLRAKCYDKLDTLAPAALLEKRSGDMISIVLNDVETLEWFYAHTIGQIFVAICVPLASLIFLGVFSPILPVTMLCFIVILIMIPRSSSRRSDEQGSEVKETTGALNAMIVDGVQGIKDIISFRWQEEYFKRFLKVNKKYSEASMAYAIRRAGENRKITLVMDSAALVVDVIAAALVVAGDIPAIWLMPIFVLSSAIFSPIMDALQMSGNYGLIFGAAKRVLGLFAMEPTVKDDGKERLANLRDVEVKFDNVKFTYPGTENEVNQPVLNGLSFSFKTGETVALVGVSGGGKTTAARLLQRFWDVDSGSISINGTDIRQFSLNTLREYVTVVPQEVYLFNMSVSDNLKLAKLDSTDEEVHIAARQAQAERFIERLPHGYGTVIGERGLRLSGGEKQRLSIAQAFLKDAPILVLDEASANLDAENERLINKAVQSLKQGRATLVIAHRISTIRSADRVVVIQDGQAVGNGTYDSLIKSCSYFRKLIGDEYEGG